MGKSNLRYRADNYRYNRRGLVCDPSAGETNLLVNPVDRPPLHQRQRRNLDAPNVYSSYRNSGANRLS